MTNRRESEVSGVNPELLKYQLEFLKLEFGAIQQGIRQLDEMTSRAKNWAVVLWAGSLGIILGKSEYHQYVVLTTCLPLVFWFNDAYLRHVQRTFIFRLRMISDFLNGPGLVQTMKDGMLSGLWLLDPRAQEQSSSEAYRKFTSLVHALRFQEVAPFYGGLMAISILVALFLPSP